MKVFKKKHDYLPTTETICRLIKAKYGPEMCSRYSNDLAIVKEDLIFPTEILAVTLARLDKNKRGHVAYYSDLRNYTLNWPNPNRSLPVKKFLSMFASLVPAETLAKLDHDLTNYRLAFYTKPDDWEKVYADDTVHSCMSGTDIVRTYAHPENNLALAALYAPGGTTVIARTIVNTAEKWYVRLFGDALLVDKLKELGYRKLDGYVTPFKMYAKVRVFPVDRNYIRDYLSTPYFDFSFRELIPHPETYDPVTQYVEITVR